jgi:hypothetical protein
MRPLHRIGLTTLTMFAALAVAGWPASASSTRTITGHFPIEDSFTVEPDSTICGFPITLDITGQGTFSVLLDADGNPIRLHVLERTTGTISANGISLRDVSSDNKIYDFVSGTAMEVGLVFRDSVPGARVVIMDRGRLVWNFDPDTGEFYGDPLFEAGPHPELHGDIAALCSALTP